MAYNHRALIAHLIAGLLAAGAAGSAVAQSGPTLRVHYRASELTSEQGAKAVFERIKSGARRVCSSEIYMPTRYRCRQELVGLAVNKLGDARVIAMWTGEQPTRLAAR